MEKERKRKLPPTSDWPFAFAVWDTVEGRIVGRVMGDYRPAEDRVAKYNATNEDHERYCLFKIDERVFQKYVGKSFDEYFFPERFKHTYAY